MPYFYFDAVALFHKTFRTPASATPTLYPEGVEDFAQLKDLRIRLLQEEIDELDDAFKASDVVEVSDAIADILYLVYGTAVTYGIRLGDMPTHRVRSVPTLFPSGDLVDDIQSQNDSIVRLQLYLDNLKSSIENDDLLGVENELEMLAAVAHVVAYNFSIDIDPVFFEVQRSNMSKLDENGEPLFRADGKIIKSKLYSPPDIAPILERQRASLVNN